MMIGVDQLNRSWAWSPHLSRGRSMARRARHGRARAQRPALVGPHAHRMARPRLPLALDVREQQFLRLLLDELDSSRFFDAAPAAMHAARLDEGRYLGSMRTMYRLLASRADRRP